MSTNALYDALTDRLIEDMPAEVNRLGMTKTGFLCHVYACVAVVMKEAGIVTHADFSSMTPEKNDDLAEKVAKAMGNKTLIAVSTLVDGLMS